MVSTYLSYQLIARDIDSSLQQVQKQPLVKRETDYFLENITKVTSIDEFVDDDRLFNYAMKAFGLGDMAYAKAFMVKALKEGVSDSASFANKLTDKRYASFVKTFNFAALDDQATTYNLAQQGTVDRYQAQAVLNGVSFDDPTMKEQSDYYLANISKVKSIDDFLANDKLYTYAMKAYELTDRIGDKAFIREALEGGVSDPDSLANKQSDTKLATFVAAFNFAQYGEEATTHVPAQQDVVDMYARQTLEENAGESSEGVRLALYFQRKASGINSAYDILADKALSEVVRTAFNMPDSVATADIDKQAQMITQRLDLADLQDPEALNKFLTRFTTMWEIQNGGSATSVSPAVLFSQPVENGISTDVLLTLAKLGR